jgi:crotonobetainyl-CoA:carnitine CoA-transferase CaiB-like acyl-CoA transferase
MLERKSLMTGVLHGIRVLDLSQGIAGPIAGMLLADHGAAVTKIEPPGGDRFRALPGSAAWLRGRRSVELDLAKTADAAVFHAMALPNASVPTPRRCSGSSPA